MKNAKILTDKIDEALEYLVEQEKEILPCINFLQGYIKNKLPDSSLKLEDAFDIYLKLQGQYTNSIMLMTKMKEILEFKE